VQQYRIRYFLLRSDKKCLMRGGAQFDYKYGKLHVLQDEVSVRLPVPHFVVKKYHDPALLV
jgi:hypothetical protein